MTVALISFFKKDEFLSIALPNNPDFHICTGNINKNLICKKRPNHMRETATFTTNQNVTKVVHPFDLETDDLGVKIVLTENVRFYEYETIDNSPNVGHEVSI